MHEQYLTIFEKLDFCSIIDHPNILIAAAFWDEERYIAAKICYKYMRAIDDLIDHHKSAHSFIADNEKQQFVHSVQSWVSTARDAAGNKTSDDELTATIKKFHIPLWPLEAFAKSMLYDIDHTGFSTVNDFLEYSQGASVAPASIFVHLNGLVKKNNIYLPPAFDVRSSATPCAIFSYLVHIIRDFQKDQFNNLNYFADDILAKYGLTGNQLQEIARGGKVTTGFRNMVNEYLQLADTYRKATYKVIEQVSPLLEPRYRLSLQIIFNLYLMVYERIDVNKGSFTTEELNPTPEETRKRVYETIMKFKE